MSENKIPLLGVVGPTASGKTALAVELALRLDAEVIGADSMQVYREMQIATAKPTLEEMRGVPHHLIGFLPPGEAFSVAQYTALAAKAVQEIYGRGRLPLLCGGTGLFVDALTRNIQFVPQPTDMAYREALRERERAEGAQALLQELEQVDPISARKLHPNNLGRIIRALEVYHVTGKPISYWNERSKSVPSPYQSVLLGITFRQRERLYERIDRRVDRMMEEGLLEETRAVLSMGRLPTAFQAIGYKELAPFLRGECPLDTAVDKLKQSTRRYAKRQLTWFRRNPEIHWLYADEIETPEELLARAIEQAKEVLR